MESAELGFIERRARRKYELSRARRALLGFAPALLIVAVAALLNKQPRSALAFGTLLFALGVVLLWYGRDLKRAVLPGIAAGLIPLTLSLCSKLIGHVCPEGSCWMLCIPACVAGGLVSGVVVAFLGQRGRHGVGFWVFGSGIALLTGAMGCSVIGYSGIVGLVVGYLGGAMPLGAYFWRSRRSAP